MSNTFPSLSGGIPNKTQDFAASIVFAIAFAALIPAGIARLVSKDSRSFILIRPSIFCITQVAAYGMRAALANGNSSTGVYIASEILLLGGFSAICEPIPALLTRVAGKCQKRSFQHADNKVQQHILLFCRLVVTLAGIFGVIASTKISGNESQSTANSIEHYRIANAALIIGAISVSALIAVNLIQAGLLQILAVVVIVLQCGLLIITTSYKLGSTLDPPGKTSRSGKIVFYILIGVMDWLITLIFFAVNINQLFPLQSAKTFDASSVEEQDEKIVADSPKGTHERLSGECV